MELIIDSYDNCCDIQCSICGNWRSIDLQKGYETKKKELIELASKEGWKNVNGQNICPLCN